MKRSLLFLAAFLLTSPTSCCAFSTSEPPCRRAYRSSSALHMTDLLSRKDLIRKLLKGLETGDPEAARVVSEERYVQHNPQTKEGGEGLAALFKRLSKTHPRVNIVRAFEDGDFVFGHTEYDFRTRRIGFEVFRFEGNQAVEHWDNIQPRKGTGDSMVSGPTEATDLHLTQENRSLVSRFVKEVFLDGLIDKADDYMNGESFVQHSPLLADGLTSFKNERKSGKSKYEKMHRVLAEGNFVLVVCEGFLEGVHTSFYDLYRVDAGKLVEHWDTVETVPPKSEWKNNNGKF